MYKKLRKYMAVVLSMAVALGSLSVNDITAVQAVEKKIGNQETVDMTLPVGGWGEPQIYYLDDSEAAKVPLMDVSNTKGRRTTQKTIFERGIGDYGYKSLSQAQQTFYNRISESLTAFEGGATNGEYTEITLDGKTSYVPFQTAFADMGLDENQASQVWIAFVADHPGLFWLENGCAITSEGLMPIVREGYWGDAATTTQKREQVKQEIEQGVKEYEKVADYYQLNYDKVREMDEMIISHVDFAYESDGKTPEKADWAHTIEGVFAGSSRVVGEGYAKAFAFLLNILDIPNVYVTGDAGDSGKEASHAWNLVSFDNGVTYYCMDLTWDDMGAEHEVTGNSYLYFAMPKSKFEQKHHANTPEGTAENWLYELPELGDDMDYTYFMQYGAYGPCSELSDHDTTREFLSRVKALAPNRLSTCAMLLDNLSVSYIDQIMGLDRMSFISSKEYDMKVWANPLGDYNTGSLHPLFRLDTQKLTIDLGSETEKTLSITNVRNASGNYVRWHSDNNEVAVVKVPAYTKMEDGASVQIVAKKAGTATIRAEGRAGAMTCTVEVKGERPTPHKHKLTLHNAVSATCEAAGIGEYYECAGESGCGKLFSDAAGNTEIMQIPAGNPATGHRYGDWVSNGDGTHTHICQNDSSHQESESCSGGVATDEEQAVCSVCGGRYGEPLRDNTNPIGSIVVDTNSWDSFLNTITFELFFRETSQVTIQASDEGSGVDKVYYFVSDHTLTEAEVKALGDTAWTEGTSLAISPDRKCVIYAKITDKAGNTAYVSSNGLVFDKTAPGIRGVTDGEIYETPQEVTVTDANLKSVMVNGTSVTLTDHTFTLGAAVGPQTIVATDKAGNTTKVTVTIKKKTEGTPAPESSEKPGENVGKIDKDVQTDGKAPDTQISTPADRLADILLTPEEKSQMADGTDIEIVLEVKDASDSVSASDKALVEAALANDNTAKGFVPGQYLDISLFKIVGENRNAISETDGKIAVTIHVPDRLKNTDSQKTRTFALIRVHDGRAEFLADTDNSAETITIETDRFSTYAIVYQDASNGGGNGSTSEPTGGNTSEPTGGNTGSGSAGGTSGTENSSGKNISENKKNNDNGSKAENKKNGKTESKTSSKTSSKADKHNNSDNKAKGSDNAKDNEPKTGDVTPLELYATLAMIAGFSYLLLYFTDPEKGMTEEKKKELVGRIVRWAKRGGRFKKYLAMAAIVVLLVYYHSIGRKTRVEWEEIYGE